jgi:hypothetical protein
VHQSEEADESDKLSNSFGGSEKEQSAPKFFHDLKPFITLIQEILLDLSISKHKESSEHYDRTLKRLIEGMMEPEPEDNDDNQTTLNAKVN